MPGEACQARPASPPAWPCSSRKPCAEGSQPGPGVNLLDPQRVATRLRRLGTRTFLLVTGPPEGRRRRVIRRGLTTTVEPRGTEVGKLETLIVCNVHGTTQGHPKRSYQSKCQCEQKSSENSPIEVNHPTSERVLPAKSMSAHVVVAQPHESNAESCQQKTVKLATPSIIRKLTTEKQKSQQRQRFSEELD